MQKITTHLWFDTQAEEAARFYVSLFKESSIGSVSRYTEAAAKASGQPEGSAMTVPFTLAGQEYLALNGGPMFTFTEAISLMVHCEDQEEIDHFWNAFTAEGQESQCGWLKDKYGLSWQIVPARLGALMTDPERAPRVMAALMQMKKIDIATLEAA